MTGILTRMGRIQDAAINWQEARYRRNRDRQQQASLHRQRMTIADTARFDTQSQDWTGGMGISPSGRFQVPESAVPKKPLISGEGIRWNAAVIVITAAVLLCIAILLADLAGIGMSNRTMMKLDKKVTEIAGKNNKIQAELAMRDDDISVCTEAIKLNLISANGAQTIRLSAPAEAKLSVTGNYYPGN